MAQTTRTFRIFVSSTFSDMKEERNALQREVFPLLRELCLRHGCRFQAVDLRWGVRDEAGLDQQTMKICLDEVSRSQRASPRPNFIILLGDRYGWCPLPAEIPAREFDHIHETTTDASERQLLDAWYKRDDNACYKRDENSEQEGVYCLQPRSDRFADFQVWDSEVERPLRAILLRAIEGLELSDDERRKYEASATEQEIAAGALRVPDANEHVFCFFRSIRGLPRDQSARDFLGLDENWELDAKADTLLKKLKGELEKRLPDNIHSYEADWTGTGASTAHIGELPEKLEACLRLLDDPNSPETLCVDVWKRLASAILDETVRLGKIEPLEKEIFDHAEFGENRARAFIGRAAILQTISSYVSGSNRQPLCIWGESGSGKSALMAKAAAECGARNAESFIVSRFIGATPASSDGRSLLESICRQITRHYGGDETTIPTEYKELVKELSTRLSLATKDNPLILFLDALDQLSDADRAGNLIWLPAQLPENVRLIVSAVPGECLTALGRKLPAANIVRLEPMPASEGQYLLNRWLSQEGRTLQPHQELEVLTGFAESSRHKDEGSDAERGGEQGGLPLYLKLAFEEARRWKSYSPKVSLAPDIPGIIRQLFAWLSQDANHGAVVVSRSLGYLAASKNGLSEDEMLDILSRDKEVLDDFKSRARHTPPEERLPVIVWSRLYFDLEPYLSERSADGTSLLSFYHRQVEDAVKDNYLQDEPKRVRHRALAVYFDSQPLRIEKAGEQIPNVRKVSELPFQQTCGEMWEEIEATLCDLKFMETKCAAGMIYGLMDDYVAARSASGSRWSDSNRIADFERFLSHEAHFLRESPGLIYQQAYNTSSRLHVRAAAEELMRGRGFPGAAWLRKTAGTVAQKHGGKVISLAFWGDDSRLAVSTEAREVWVWDTERGDLWQRCDTPPSAVRSLSVSPNGKFLAGGYGSPEPSPFISGISVWETDGSSRCDFRVWEWVYSVRWESDSRLIAGAGMPSGAEAGGTVWVADLTTEECSLVKHFGSGSPVVFTSTVVSQDTPPRLIELTLSKRGGIGCVILDESASGPNPVSVEFTGESFSSSPRSAISIDNQTICMLTETAVYRVKLTAVGDRLLIEPRKLGESVISEPVCLAGSAASNEIVVETAEGGAWIVPLEGDTAPHLIHEDVFSITAASFSSSGKRIALGNGAGQVFVYNRCDNDLVFHTEHEAALAARIEDSRAIILHGDHLVLASLSDTASKESIALSDSLFARDFDVLGDLAILICYPVKELTFATHRVIQVFHLVEKRLLLSLNISAVADALGSAETLLEPSRFRRIRLQPGHDSCHVLLGSAQGVMIYPLLAFETGVPLVVPCPPAVGILSPNTPAISCEVFEIGREPETVVAGYANKTEGSEIKLRGEFRVWDTRRNEHSPPQWLSAPVNAICQDTSGAVIVGTEDGEASSWQYDQEWRRLTIIEHGVPVVAVNCSHSGYMACSASEDGNLMIWDSRTGLHLLRTFLDVKPVAASFINEDAGLCIVDKMGEVHVCESKTAVPSLAGLGISQRLRWSLSAARQVSRRATLLSTSPAPRRSSVRGRR